MSFAVSISILSLIQGAIVAMPAPVPAPWLARARSRWWAALPPLSIGVTIALVALAQESATALAYLALIAVPLLAAFSLGWLMWGARPLLAFLAAALFALAWASPGSLVGEAAATGLTALGCVALGWLLVSVVPARWLKIGIYAMAAVDTWLVVSNLLQGPNAVLSTAGPSALPHLQVIHLGSAQMGFGDFFVAATLGALLANSRPRQLAGAALVATLALAFDLLFLAVDTLPATVPVAVALALLDLPSRGRRSASLRPWEEEGKGPPEVA
jgi:hypothetical protein